MGRFYDQHIPEGDFSREQKCVGGAKGDGSSVDRREAGVVWARIHIRHIRWATTSASLSVTQETQSNDVVFFSVKNPRLPLPKTLGGYKKKAYLLS